MSAGDRAGLFGLAVLQASLWPEGLTNDWEALGEGPRLWELYLVYETQDP
jgi:hypothetical protein